MADDSRDDAGNKSKKKREFRRGIKSKLVMALGGKCVCCGYDKSLCALTFHHLNPEDKEFTIGKIKASVQSIDKIVEEAKKCVLVCNNCHTEITAGIRAVPEEAQRLDHSKIQDLKKHQDVL